MMASAETPQSTQITLDQLIALNDEISALIRAGVPLELGLRELGSDLRGNLGRLSSVLADRMSQGDSLAEALEAEGDHIPRMYRAVIEAGLRAGRLPSALESLTRVGQSLLEMHRRTTLALVYPVLVAILAYGLFVLGLKSPILDRFQGFYDGFRMHDNIVLGACQYAALTLPYWGPVFPVLFLIAIIFWFTSRRTILMRPSGGIGICARLMGGVWVFRQMRVACFSELLAMLTEHGIPLQTGFVLAAQGTGDIRMVRAADHVVQSVEQGETLADSLRNATVFPAFLRWLIANGERQGNLTETLYRAAEVYRIRANYYLDVLRVFLPLAAVIVVGGGVTLLYALSLFIPLTSALNDLSMP